jgi:uncharacterized protein YggE
MTKLPIVLALALFATTAPSTAAVLLTLERLQGSSSSSSAAGADGRSINVSGEAVINVVPDLATMTFRVERKGATREAALQSVDDGVAAVLQALREQGAAPADLRTEAASFSPEYARDAHGQPLYLQVKAWVATRAVVVCTHDVQRVAPLQRIAQQAGALPFGNVAFETTALPTLQGEARVQAAVAARHKAAVLVEALGGRLGPPMAVSESATSMTGSYVQKNVSDDRTESVGVVDGDFAAGKLSVSAQVSVTFEILPM